MLNFVSGREGINYLIIFQLGDAELGASFQKMAQTVASAITEGGDPEAVSADFQSAISQALKDLSTTQENMQVIIHWKLKTKCLYCNNFLSRSSVFNFKLYAIFKLPFKSYCQVKNLEP